MSLGIAEPVFASELLNYVLQYVPLAPVTIVEKSPMAIYTNIPANLVLDVVHAYMKSLSIVFFIGVPVGKQGLFTLLSTFVYLRIWMKN